MTTSAPKYRVKLAETEAELLAAQRLRYRVFVEELGGSGELVDHELKLERDKFDPHYDHLILIDDALECDPMDQVVGAYRLLPQDRAEVLGHYYVEDEYDLTVLKQSGRKLLELGRSCLHKDYRGGVGMYHLWNGLAAYVAEHDIEILFGVASFHGTDIKALAQPLSLLQTRHLAPEDIRVRTQSEHYQSMDLMPEDQIDRRAAMLEVPSLLKAYLRMGGFVGDGAFIDWEFNTIDVCLILDTARLNEKNKELYTRERAL